MKRIISLTLVLMIIMAFAVGCTGTDNGADGGFDTSQTINVISREDGSGTRGAFVEIVGIVDENDNDLTTVDAVVQNSTNGVMTTVAGEVWGYDFEGETRTVDVHIGTLRQKLGKYGKYIQTVRNVGYKVGEIV